VGGEEGREETSLVSGLGLIGVIVADLVEPLVE